MTAGTRTLTTLTCDGCSQQVTNEDIEATTGSMVLRLALQQKAGWHFVQAMVPKPEGLIGHNCHRAVRRTWDFCGDCGVPDQLEAMIDVHPRAGASQKLKVTLVGGMVVYGGEIIE